jgi:hypothetical protein
VTKREEEKTRSKEYTTAASSAAIEAVAPANCNLYYIII